MNNINKNTTAFNIVKRYTFFDVMQNTTSMQYALCINKCIKSNEIITYFSEKEIVEKPSYLTVQVGLNKHITLLPEYLQYINHSCNPNIFFNTTTFELVALKDISAGDELTFFYPSTEWDMSQFFECNCGFTNCLKNIKGAKYLPIEILHQHKLTNFIEQMLRNRK